MEKEPKILEEGESTFRNGGEDPNFGSMCGGVISQSLFESDPWAYMMAYYMEDEKFEEYRAEKDEKKRRELFKKYAMSAI